MAPHASITCQPPLGQLSIIPAGVKEMSFSVLLEWNKVRPNYPFDVQLCYTSAPLKPPVQWQTLALERTAKLPQVLNQEDAFRACYVATLSRSDILEGDTNGALFTVKYRVNSDAPWNWTETQLGIKPGEILFQKPLSADIEFLSLLDISTEWKIEMIATAQSLPVFKIQSTVPISRGIHPPDLEKNVLGRIRDQSRYFALVRLEPYWLGPRQGKEFFHLSEDAIVCSFLTATGQVLTLVAVNGVDDIYTVFRSSDQGEIVVASRNDGKDDAPFRIVGAIASSVEDSLGAAMTEIRRMVMRSSQIQTLSANASEVFKDKQDMDYEQSFEDWIDGLAYCTWNGLGQNLTSSRILSGLKKLVSSGINISTLLIDDNWQTLGSTESDYSNPFFRGWAEFEANKQGFPQGMKGLISEIRQKYPNIRDIGVWHALLGYWGGIAKQGKLQETYGTRKIQSKLMGNVPTEIYLVESSEINRLFDEFYAWLASCGITFVKTDVQYMLGEFMTARDSADFTSAYQSAWTLAHLRHFSGKAISCMSQIPQLMFHSLLQTNTPPVVLRNSDDFYPEVAPSHPWHIWANAHNTLFTQHLNVVLDWDMFQTSHDFSAFHGAARCLSGGPILITDIPGEHDLRLLDQMTAPSPSGRTIALRPETGKTTNVFNAYTEGNVLKVATRSIGAGFLGLFNVSDHRINFFIDILEFSSPKESVQFVGTVSAEVIVRSHMTGRIFGPLKTSHSQGPESLIYSTLLERGYDILSLQPVHHIEVGAGELSFSIIGLVGKMTGAAAVTSISVQPSGNKARVQITLKALGILAIWLMRPFEGTIAATVQGKEATEGEITRKETDAGNQLLEIDLLHIWKTQNLWDAATKEVQVELIFG